MANRGVFIRIRIILLRQEGQENSDHRFNQQWSYSTAMTVYLC